MPNELLSIATVEKRLGVSRKTVLGLVRRRELTGFKVGRQWRFDPKDVDAYIDARKAAAAPTPAPRVPNAPAPRPRTTGPGVSWKGADRYLR